MDIKIIGDDGKEVKNKEEKFEHEEMDGPVSEEMTQRAVEQVLGLDENGNSGKFKNEVRTLIEYAESQTKDHSPESIKWVIRELELKVGTPPFGEHRVRYLARYAYLNMEGKKIEEEKKQFI